MAYDFTTIIDRRNTSSEKWSVAENELPMWIADMDFQTAPEVIEAIQERLNHHVFGYSSVPDAWYEAYISWWKTRHDFALNKDWLIFTTGVVPAISSLVRKLTTPAEKVVVMTPVYNIFFNSIVNNGRVPLQSPLDFVDGRYEINFERLETDLADPQATMLLLCNPQNPGGRIWTKEELSRIAELCKRYGVIVVSDEIHCDLVRPGHTYVPFASVSDTAADISVSLYSPTKAFNLAGIHTAAASVPNENLRHRVWRCLNTDECAEPDAFAVPAAIAAFTKGGAWLDELNQVIDENLTLAEKTIREEVPTLKTAKEDATYLLWIDVRDLPGEGRDFAAFLRRQTGLVLSDGPQYGKAGEGFVRLNVACPRETLEDGLGRLVAGTRAYLRERG